MKDDRPLIIITARIGSSRLPGKVLKPFWKEYSILEFLIRRLQAHEETSRITLATVDSPENDVVAEMAAQCDVQVVRGPEDNVVDRMGICLGSLTAGYVARVTADNPFTDPDLFMLQWDEMKRQKANYSFCRRSPIGTAADIWTVDCFRSTMKNASTRYELEHANAWVWNNPGKNRILWFIPPSELIDDILNLSVDREDDFRRVKNIVERLEYPIEANILQLRKVYSTICHP